MSCTTTVQAIGTAAPSRPGLLARLLAAYSAPAPQELDPATLRDIGLSEEWRTREELREAWRRFMPTDVMRGQ
jgi:hypothetical protein